MPITWNLIFLAGFLAFGVLAIVNTVQQKWADAERRATLSLAFLLAYWVSPGS